MRQRVATSLLVAVLAAGLVSCTGDDAEPADPVTDDATGDEGASSTGPTVADPTLCVIDGEACVGDPGDPPGTGLVCSGTAVLGAAASPGALVGSITLDDQPLLRVDVPAADLTDRDGEPVALRFALGVPVPEGEYRCRFDLGGELTQATLSVDGPSEVFWDHRVCDREDALELSPGVLACSTDADRLPADTAAVACTTGVRPGGQPLQLTYSTTLDRGHDPEPATLAIDPGELPIATANGAVDAALFGGSAGDPLPAGEHTCRFELEDGSVASERTFRIG
ncbi:hypothetical protein [Nitriliruptor alkaliphilus]|uniref:hypothetical protein n=1 Tax=Nitriliruptor alkaliphilus TaxID=427918 RepID=UPI00146FDE67|nr:hypothetical protein [Nitriliruptor alkaliphilus]